MIVRNDTGNRLEGLYRGIVLKHLPHGKCKIFIPGVYSKDFYEDPDSLPTAQQKACLFAGTNEGNGVFTYPNLSTIVWCQFLNGDVNYPIYDSVTLGGEDAFGQYELIKGKDEKVSERHMITSGKTHMLWYEKGILSGIVEDPIRTQCSVDYDKYELENNNISVDDKYSYEISNDIVKKISKNEISNINCQYVFNNDAGTHGELSVSTHWYDIISVFLSDEQYTAKGQISTDSYFKMNNDGLTKFNTLSIYSINEVNGQEGTTSTAESTTHNEWKYTVDNTYDNVIDQQSLSIFVDNDGSTKTLSAVTSCNEHRGNRSDVKLDTSTELTSIFLDVQQKKTINDISKIENVDQMLSAGGRKYESKITDTYISADQNAGSMYSKKLELESKTLNIADEGLFQTTFLSTLKLDTINSPSTLTKKSELTNIIEANVDGKMKLMVKHDFTLTSSDLKQFIKSHDTIEQSIVGKHSQKLKYNKGQGTDSSDEHVIDNKYDFSEDISDDSTFEIQMIGKKLSNSSPYIDGIYNQQVNASTCKSIVKFVDNIVEHEYRNTLDVKLGKHEVYLTNSKTGSKCILVAKEDGTFEFQTTTSVKVVTKTVLVQAEDITMQGSSIVLDGPTHVKNQLKVDIDTVTAGISFIGHKHIGNMGAATSPPF